MRKETPSAERKRLRTLQKLYQKADSPIDEMISFLVEESVRMTESRIGLFGFINEDETLMSVRKWSKRAMKDCFLDVKLTLFSIREAGIWAEPIRQHRPLIVNNYHMPDLRKKCYPEGHAPLERLMSVPIIKEGKAVAVAAVANKDRDYTESDLLQFSFFLETIWGILQWKRSDDMLRVNEDRLSRIIENCADGMVIVDGAGIIRFLNPAAELLFGRSGKELLGTPFGFPAAAGDRSEIEIPQPNQRDVVVTEIRVTEIDWQGKPSCLAILRDITERKKTEAQLTFLSIRDSLTGLYNRFYFEEEMRRLGSGRFDPAGIIMCDVDALKLVNDTLGHGGGDDLLRAISTILKSATRESDVVVRIGGDEFAILLPRTSPATVERICKRIEASILRHNAETTPLPVSLSIGFAVKKDASVDIYDVYREADNNMYKNKRIKGMDARRAILLYLMKDMEKKKIILEGRTERLTQVLSSIAGNLGMSNEETCKLLFLARFYDVGKVSIIERVRSKSGLLTEDEVTEMRAHAEAGYRLAQSVPYLAPIADGILKHHEWWNGKGYPLGLKGEDIPLECRLIAIVEAYDAMTHDRGYRKTLTHETAVAELRKMAGTQFDPDLVETCIQIMALRNPVP